MKSDLEPRRVLEGDAAHDDDLRKLLGSAREDGPSTKQMSAMAAALGVPWQPTNSMTKSLDSDVTRDMFTPNAAASITTNASWPLLAIAGAVAGLGILGAALWTTANSSSHETKTTAESEEPPQQAPTTTPASAPPANTGSDARSTTPPTPSAAASMETSQPKAKREVVPTPAALRKAKQSALQPPASSSAPSAGHPPASANNLEAEFRLIQRAQRLLTQAPRRALQLVAEHEAAFPRGELIPEREAIAIEALWASEQRDAARRRAKSFLQNYPQSSYQNKIRQALKENSP